ncbi:unnamed protein product, partial [Laminaria digitata]
TGNKAGGAAAAAAAAANNTGIDKQEEVERDMDPKGGDGAGGSTIIAEAEKVSGTEQEKVAASCAARESTDEPSDAAGETGEVDDAGEGTNAVHDSDGVDEAVGKEGTAGGSGAVCADSLATGGEERDDDASEPVNAVREPIHAVRETGENAKKDDEAAKTINVPSEAIDEEVKPVKYYIAAAHAAAT